MASRRTILLATLTTVALTASLTAMAAIAQAPPTEQMPEAPLAETRHQYAAQREMAAREDSRLEQERLSAAQSEFAAALSSEPDVAQPYLVSLGAPVALEDVLAAFPQGSSGQLRTLFAWGGTDESVFPVTSTFSAEDLGWPRRAAADVSARVATFLRSALVRQIASVEAAIARADSESGETLRKQLTELETIASRLSARGPELYGFSCSCSPLVLASLASSEPSIIIRAAESGGEDRYQSPVWPMDRLRELIIESNGRYGR